jgi:hypothetical protein
VYSRTTVDKFNSSILRFAVAIYPYIFLADAIYEFNILGSSFYFILELFLLFLLFVVNLIRDNLHSLNITLLMVFVFLFFLLVNLIIYNNNLYYLKDYRLGIGVVMYIYVAKATIVNDRERYFLGKIIIINAIALSVFALTHHHYFEHVIVCMQSSDPESVFVVARNDLTGMRECSFVFQPTVFATLVLMGMFINIFLSINIYKKIKWRSFALTILFMYAILLSSSRLPIVFAILLTILHLYKLMKSKSMFWSLVFFSLLLISSTSFDHPAIERLARMELGGNRYERYLVGLQTVFYNLPNALIGTNRLLMTELRTSSGVKFTDNSFIYIMLHFGVIYLYIIVFYIIISLSSKVDSTKNVYQLLLVLFIFFELMFTSFILQDILLLYSFTTLILLGKYPRDKVLPQFNT